MLEASAKSSNILSALPDRLSSGLFARATACHLDAGETLFNIGDDGNGCYRLAWHRVAIDGDSAWLCWVERRWLDRYHDDGFWEYRRVPNRLIE
jgi:hypothetical protein